MTPVERKREIQKQFKEKKNGKNFKSARDLNIKIHKETFQYWKDKCGDKNE